MFAKQSSSPIHSGVAFHIVRFIPLNFSSRVVLCVFSSSSPTVMTMTRAAAKRSSVPDTVKNPHSLKLSSSRKKQKVPANTRKGQAKGSKDMTSTPCEEGDRPVEEQVINENRVQEVLQSGIKHVSQNPTTTPCNEKSDSASRGRSYFLVKSEPETRMQDGHDMKFSIDDLGDEPNATACWDGVRNYEARNIMREMREGDRAFFYHSNSRRTLPAIVGEVEIVREAYPGTKFSIVNFTRHSSLKPFSLPPAFSH